MSSEFVIKVENASKCYQIYEHPRDRLKQFILPRLQSALGRSPETYCREFWALKNVSFEVEKGEAIGVIGRNGSGKSTLLQMICGTLNPTSGNIFADGRIAALLELGSGFSPDFTGRENVYMNAAVLGLSKEEIDFKYGEILDFAGIGEFIEQPVKTYSSGMMLRLAFAVQVCIEPEILVVDEALAVGDALFQKRCFERMERLRNNGTTLLFVSHDQESVRTLTNRSVFLHQGCVQFIGNSAAAILEYRKLLHEEETHFLNESALRLKEKASKSRAERTRLAAATETSNCPANQSSRAPVADMARSGTMSFGDLEAEVLKVVVLSAEGDECAHFGPRDHVRIIVTCVAHTALDQLNVSLRIRNREGVKLYSWGTLNQDIAILAGGMEGDIFWNRCFKPGQQFSVAFSFTCGLGSSLYEVQTAVTREGKPYYSEQRILHWMDEAAFFTVTSDPREYHFGGVADLKMISQYQEELL